METSETITKISAAILKAQMSMGVAHKDSQNPFFKSKYADLNSIREACMPALNANGISVLQPTIQIDGKNFVQTVLLHESGERISGLTEIVYSKSNDAQSQGSGITYARRYGLQSLMNVGAEDDDGTKASAPTNGHATAPVNKSPELTKGTPAYKKAVIHIAQGGSIDQVKKTYHLSPEIEKQIFEEAKTVSA
jgi:hypothetical protein